jgi:hypothetical protein
MLAEIPSHTTNLAKPSRAKIELDDGASFETNVGFAKGVEGHTNARITMHNHEGEIPENTLVTLLE